MQQKSYQAIASTSRVEGEAQYAVMRGSEIDVASKQTESLATANQLMELICEPENLKQALKRVKQNKGAPGVDGMSVEELVPHLRENWLKIKDQLFSGSYIPQPVRRVEIPKPGGRGVRKLGVPCAIDRFIQQAILQPLQKQTDPTFSEHSYGFRPGKSAHQAIAKAQEYIDQGYRYTVDIDLEKFFDQVNHDKLMSEMAKRIPDKRVLKLIRTYLQTGILENGLVSVPIKGTIQGGPLSPLLSNIMLDLLDKKLEERGHKFCRFADDCNIYVKSKRAGERVMEGVTKYLETKLKLKVNQEKSAVAKAYTRQFLGFSFTSGRKSKRRISHKAINSFKDKIRELTKAGKGKSMGRVIAKIKVFMRGWLAYYGQCETQSVLSRLESWLFRKLRCAYWRQWKTGANRGKKLRALGVGDALLRQTAGSGKGPWHVSMSPALSYALPRAYFVKQGLPKMVCKKK